MCTVYCDPPAMHDGFKYDQVFVGTNTLLTDVYGMKPNKQCVTSLVDNTRKRGEMEN